MNRGLLAKAIRETRGPTLVFGIGLLIAATILSYVLPTFQKQFNAQVLEMPFIRTMVSAMIGTDASVGLSPDMFAAICWVHPVILGLTWAHALVCCTRIPAAELEAGTIDVLLGLPVSRWQIMAAETTAWLAMSACLIGFAFAGHVIGSSLVEGGARPPLARGAIAAVSLWCLYVAVGSFAWLMSSLSDRRGRAILWAVLLVLATFLLNYLAQIWRPAERVAFLSILRYHRPLVVLRDGHWPLRDMGVLVGLAGLMWTAAGLVFARRDLTTT